MEDLVGAALGWLGTAGTFSAYLMIWRGWVSPDAIRYAALNAVGGLLAAGGALVYGAWPAVASNLVWGVIGFHGLACALRSRLAKLGTALPAVPDEAAEILPPPRPVPHSGGWTPSVTDALAISLPWLDPARGAQPEDPSAFDTIPISLPWLRAEAASTADPSEAASANGTASGYGAANSYDPARDPRTASPAAL